MTRLLAIVVIFALFAFALAASNREKPLLVSGLEAPVMHSGILNGTSSADLASIAPPERFQRDGAALIIFASIGAVATLCGGPDGEGHAPIGCAGVKDRTPIIIAPNPCLAAGQDVYAAIMCHELGHVNGWPPSHGD